MKYKIVNKFRFFTVLTVIAVVASIVFFTVIADAANSSDITLTTVSIEKGDTLWGLAQEYAGDNVDLRDYINQVIHINRLKSVNIHPGQIILLPQ